jgi:carbonic anhydrase/acetyltransferase-like protein (isoleucine patch superfamily)
LRTTRGGGYDRAVLITVDGLAPDVHADAYVHDSASVVGDVRIGAQSSVWFHVVLRGDGHFIRIGERTNVQDNSTIHVATGRHPTIVGDDVTIGHNVVLHGCTIGNRCLIGIGAIVLDGAVIGDDCMIGAGALVTPGTKIEPGCLAIGSPAKVHRPLREEELLHLRQSAANYVANARRYRVSGI